MMVDHTHRELIAGELHARPYISLDSPVEILHLALVHGDDDGGASRAHLGRMLEAAGTPWHGDGPANHCITRLGDIWLKWERHAEFTSWTLWRDTRGASAFAGPVDMGADGIDALPGELLVALHMHVLGPGDPAPQRDALDDLFDPGCICGSTLGAGTRMEVWTDFRPTDAGHVRMLLHEHTGDRRQLGRRVQRLIEIETYRCMALLGLPVAQEIAPRIAEVEAALAHMTHGLEILEDLDAEKTQLQNLMQLSAQSEDLASTTAYRFSASSAYFAIVEERMERLAEEPIGDLPTIGGFMARRLSPAMRTCEHTRSRLDALAARITRAGNLLRTQVDLALEAQNQKLLLSMERRARLQLRLQETVEGLSVAAITYYVVGLVGYLSKAAAETGLPMNTAVATGIAVPVVALIVWSGVRRMRRHIERDEAT